MYSVHGKYDSPSLRHSSPWDHKNHINNCIFMTSRMVVRQQRVPGFHCKQDEILHFMQKTGGGFTGNIFPHPCMSYKWDSPVSFFFRAAMFFGFHGMNVAICLLDNSCLSVQQKPSFQRRKQTSFSISWYFVISIMAILPVTILLCLNVPYVSHNRTMQIRAGNIALRWHNNYEILLLTSLESCAYYTSQLLHKEHGDSGDTEEYKIGSDNLSHGAPPVKRN